VHFSLKAGEELPEDSPLKQGLYPVMAWMVFTSTIVHGVTVPSFLLGSALHPSLHPKWLVQNDDGSEGEDGEEDSDDDGEMTQSTEQTGLMAPVVNLFKRYGAAGNDSAQRSKSGTEKGKDITREELHKVLHQMAGEAEDEANTTKGRTRGRLNERQKEILLGEGTGLDWTGKKVEVFDEGDTLIITDETGKSGVAIEEMYETADGICVPIPVGKVSTRKILKPKGNRKSQPRSRV
jgi:hypothetical protein